MDDWLQHPDRIEACQSIVIMNEQESPMKITTLGELQWWSLEVISGTIMAVGVGIFAGRQSLGLARNLSCAAAGVLLSVFLIGVTA